MSLFESIEVPAATKPPEPAEVSESATRLAKQVESAKRFEAAKRVEQSTEFAEHAFQTPAVTPDNPSALPHAARPSFWQRYWPRLIISAVVVLGLRTFVGEASVVPTGSMERTVLVGDHILVDKLLYGPEVPLVNWRLPRLKSVHRGDVVVFRYPKDPSQTFIKRVAAVGGDHLEMRDGVVYLNSRRIAEPYAVHKGRPGPSEQVGPLLVPPNCLFVMGDNRDNSSDSRDWGFVPTGNVIGEPMFIYWSYDAPTADWLEKGFNQQLAFDASIAGHFFRRTRWSRTGLRF